MNENSTLTILAREIGLAFSDWTDVLEDKDIFSAFMLSMGWEAKDIPPQIKNLTPYVSQLKSILDNIDEFEIGDIIGIFGSNGVNGLIASINDLKNIPGSAFPDITDIATFRATFPRQFLDFILINYLENYHFKVYAFLKLLGIITETQIELASAQLKFLKQSFEFEKLPDLIKDPFVLLRNAYKWNTSDFDYQLLIDTLAEIIDEFNQDFSFRPLHPNIVSFLTQNASQPNLVNPSALTYQIFPRLYSNLPFSTGVQLFYLPQTNDRNPGFAIIPYIIGKESLSVDLSETLSLSLIADFDFSQGVSISVLPDEGVKIASSISGTSPVLSGSLIAEIKNKVINNEPLILVGSGESSNVQVKSFAFRSGVKKQSNFSVFAEFELQEGKIIIQPDPNDSDSFVNSLLPANGFSADMDLTFGFDTVTGFYFKGSAGLEINLPSHIELGPIEIQNLVLGLMPKDGTIPVNIGASIKGSLGPLQAVVENMGIKAIFSFPKNNAGNLGPLELDLGFKPPKGVGLSIDAGVVKGGGYLFFDFDREEYAGALELVFSEWIALKAIGLITTKMPDGSKGFSLLVIITAEFGSGIQLGFGFTLLGVGGLLGLNRTVNIEPLKEGIRTGAVESLMFPQDVVANAPRIISDLRRFFPPVKDIFLVGPMAKIGWGTPPLLQVSLGVILEFPNVTITILGVLKVILPDENADILRLQVNFVGRVEPSNQLLWFYAELYGSRVLFITLEGGMGLLVNWGDNANFVVSVGGFHPRYSPPPLPFPAPPRLAANILNESWARVRIEGYFAVTSNSVQFGARAELYFGVSAFGLEGHLGFDALFQFNPFFFSFSLSFSLSVKVFGLGLWSVGFSGLLEGPTPWHIKGKGSISLFFFSISVPFEHTWGGSRATKLDPIEVFPLLEKEFNALTNWEAVLPASSNLLVSLRKLGEAETGQLVLHPVGKLRISQRKIPLDFKLDKVGNQRPADVHRVSVDAAIPGDHSLSTSKRQEKFAIGQFKDLDDADRLSSPAFQTMESGMEITVAGEQTKTSQGVKRVIRYETVIIDNNFKRHVNPFFVFLAQGFAQLNSSLFDHFLAGNAVTKSVLSQHYKNRIQPFEEVIHIQPNQYSVAFNSDNRPIDAGAASFSSQAKAMEYMQQHIQSDPNLANSLHVIPNSEVNFAV